MTCGAGPSAGEGEGGVTVREGFWVGRGPVWRLGRKVSRGPFYPFFCSFVFHFLFSNSFKTCSKHIQIHSNQVQKFSKLTASFQDSKKALLIIKTIFQ
jgi:hypothetical protein